VSADSPEGAPQTSNAPGAARTAAKKTAARASRVRVRMVGTGPDYIDGTVKVLPADEAQRLIRLGHAR
jgi:hypothetical protein